MKIMRSPRSTRRSRARAARNGGRGAGAGTTGEYLLGGWRLSSRYGPPADFPTPRTCGSSLIPHLGDIALVALRPHHLEAMYRSLASDPRSQAGPATMARVHPTLMSALGTAVVSFYRPRRRLRGNAWWRVDSRSTRDTTSVWVIDSAVWLRQSGCSQAPL